MHETAIAESLLAVITAEVEKQNAKPLTASLSCGQLDCINQDVLDFAFAAIAAGTVCEGLKLSVEHKSLQGHCRDCDKDFPVDLDEPMCPDCKADNFALLPEPPLVLEEIEFETE